MLETYIFVNCGSLITIHLHFQVVYLLQVFVETLFFILLEWSCTLLRS